MKRKIFIFFLIFTIAFIFASCENVVNKIQIIAAPSLYAPLGSKTIEATDFFTEDIIKDSFSNSETNIKVYKYDIVSDPLDTPMTFLVHYPLMNMPLDFKSYMQDLNMESLSSTIPNLEFTVPELTGLDFEDESIKIDELSSFSGGAISSEIASIVNSSLSNSFSIKEKCFEISGDGVKAVTFSSGNNVSMTIEPQIQTLAYDQEIYIELEDGTRIDFEPTGETNKYSADFSGRTIKSGFIYLRGSLELSGVVNEGDEIPAGGVVANVILDTNLNNGFSNAIVDVDPSLELSKTEVKELPESFSKMVSKVHFTSVGVSLLPTENSLPEGNNISVNIESSALGLNETQEIEAGNTDPVNFTNTDYNLEPTNTTSISITMNVILPDYNEMDKTISVINVKPGETYKIAGNANVIAEWDTITISSDTFEGSYPDNGEPMDFGELTEILPEDVKLKNIDAFLYLNSPIVEGKEDELIIKSTIYTDVTGEKDYLLGSETEGEKIEVRDPLALPVGEETNWTSVLPEPSASFGEKINDMIYSESSGLLLKYNIKADEITLTQDEIKENSNLSFDMIIKIPLEFEINGSEDIDGLKYAKFDIFKMMETSEDEESENSTEEVEDMFGRTEESMKDEDDSIKTLLEQVECLKMEVKYNNKLGFASIAEFYDEASGIKKQFQLNKGEGTAVFELKGQDVEKIQNSYPFSPRIYMYFPNTSETQRFMIRKQANIDFSIAVIAVTDINYTYEFDNDEGDM